jgi:hypothetical protein
VPHAKGTHSGASISKTDRRSSGAALADIRRGHQSEWAAFGITTDGESLAWVDNVPTEFDDPSERSRQVVHSKVGQRHRIAWASPALVNAQRCLAIMRLPTSAFGGMAIVEGHVEHAAPESSRALGIVSREFDECNCGRWHTYEDSRWNLFGSVLRSRRRRCGATRVLMRDTRDLLNRWLPVQTDRLGA